MPSIRNTCLILGLVALSYPAFAIGGVHYDNGPVDLPPAYTTLPKSITEPDPNADSTVPLAPLHPMPDQNTSSSRPTITTYQAKPYDARDEGNTDAPSTPFDSSGFGVVYQPQLAPSTSWSFGKPDTDSPYDPTTDPQKLHFDKTIADDVQAGVEYHIPY